MPPPTPRRRPDRRRAQGGLRCICEDCARCSASSCRKVRSNAPPRSSFEDADLAVDRASDVAYRATIDDPHSEVRILRPQEIPLYVADGLFDLGITGRDLVEERGAPSSRSVSCPTPRTRRTRPGSCSRSVPIPRPTHSPSSAAGLAGRGHRSGSVPNTPVDPQALGRPRHRGGHRGSYGATEAKVPDIVDAVVDMTETGGALRAAGLKVIETLPVSHTELVANPAAAADPEKRHAMEQILTLLQGTLEARGKVLVKLNVSAENLDAVLGVLPSMRAPTISELSGGGAYALETVVAKSGINTLIPALRDQGPPTSWSSPSPRSSTEDGWTHPFRRASSRARRHLRTQPGAWARWTTTTGRPMGSTPPPSRTAAGASRSARRGGLHRRHRVTAACYEARSLMPGEASGSS